MVDAGFAGFTADTDEKHQEFYEFQQKLNAEGVPIPLYSLSCEQLGLDMDCPIITTAGPPQQFPPGFSKSAKRELIDPKAITLHSWRVQVAFWLIHMDARDAQC